MSNSFAAYLGLLNNLSYDNPQNCLTAFLLLWGCLTTCRTTTTNKKMSNSLVGFLELLNNLSYDSTASQNCRAAFLLLWGCPTNLSHDNNKQNCPTVLLPTRGCPTTCHTTTANKKTVIHCCYSTWRCLTACRTTTNQTVQQSCYLPGAVPQPVVHQPTKLSNSLVTWLVLSHNPPYINKPNCSTALLPA